MSKRDFAVVWNSALEKGVETSIDEVMMEDWAHTYGRRKLPMGIVREQIMELMKRHFMKHKLLPTDRDLNAHAEIFENLVANNQSENNGE